ncbi:TetR/AcrR family transcriptional regulator [Bryobacter aggregatus]|uniref:TetR/AcrR family transcriptional regulator n=1 Tax=Bryobacter aggregatus TaxID=360054 RepID=UPI0006895908|nr:TetR/AcrR family transcriptional regulator [Bryobacter aggregatus]
MARPRSQQAHSQVLNAAIALFGERGIDATSMDAIAEASGVSKATIYKYWRDKEALCLEVLRHLHGLDQEPVIFNSGNTRADLVGQLSRRPRPEFAEARSRIMPHLIAYSARNESFGLAWRELVMEPSRQQLKRILLDGVARGELRDLDLESSVAILLGSMMYNHIFRKNIPEMPEKIVDFFWRANAKVTA